MALEANFHRLSSKRFDNAILVVLYNKEIKASKTLETIRENISGAGSSVVVIWNNGPQALTSHSFSLVEHGNCEVLVIETLENTGLAKIYNSFCGNINSTRYVLMDDDTALNAEYLGSINEIGADNAGVPIIYQNEKRCSLRVNKILFQGIENDDVTIKHITAFTSGLVLGCHFLDKIRAVYGDAFDSRFILYAVDTTLFHRINNLGLCKSFKILPPINHSLSLYEEESEETKLFRKIEQANAYALVVRFYKPLLERTKVLVGYLCSFLVKKLVLKTDIIQTHFLKAYFKGRHYRDS